MNLAEMSQKLGVNLDLVQGAGGNTSEKSGGILRIKASGFELQQALKTDIFVNLDLGECLERIESGFGDDLASCAIEIGENTPRPSIETALHSLMPQNVVVHTHSINTIAASILLERRDQLAIALEGFNWSMVPYFQPGRPLADAVRSALGKNQYDIVILQNHGLVVGAQTAEMAFELTHLVDQKLSAIVDSNKTHPGKIQAPKGLSSDLLAGFDIPNSLTIQSLASSKHLNAEHFQFSLFPDFTVFLGPGVAIAVPGESAIEASERCSIERGASVNCVVFPGQGVALSKASVKRGAEANLEAFARLIAVLPIGAEVSHLSRDAEWALTQWEAEAYRRNLSNNQSASNK